MVLFLQTVLVSPIKLLLLSGVDFGTVGVLHCLPSRTPIDFRNALAIALYTAENELW